MLFFRAAQKRGTEPLAAMKNLGSKIKGVFKGSGGKNKTVMHAHSHSTDTI